MGTRPVTREYRTWVADSRRWQSYRPRPDDVIVTTYPKCGTTWMQRIVNLLIFQSPQPRPVSQISPWYDMRIGPPVEALNLVLDAQTHRRALKTHLPFDGIPRYPGVRYIHVARDGRDACLSFHNHSMGFTEEALAKLDKAGLEDPEIGKPYERLPPDPADYFHLWLTSSRLNGFTDGYQLLSYFDFERSYWVERQNPSLLMVHYADLKRDLAGEMRRVAQFLGVEVAQEIWPTLVEAATFKTMKEQADRLMPNVISRSDDGAQRFFNKGENGRWQGILRQADLDFYARKMAQLPEDCQRWLAFGRLGSLQPEIT